MNKKVLIQCGDHFENQQRIVILARILLQNNIRPIILMYDPNKGSLFKSEKIDVIYLNDYFNKSKIKNLIVNPKDLLFSEAKRNESLIWPSKYNQNLDKSRKYIVSLQDIIEHVNPDHICIWNGFTGFVANALRLLTKSYGLPFSFLERGLFSDSLFIDNEGVNGASSLCTTKAGSWSSESYSENLHDFCKKIFFKKDDKKYNKPKEFNSKRLIFFPLQVQLDTNIIYYSPFKTMREAFIRIYEKFNDESTFFVVRPHPEEVEDFKVNLPVYNNIIISSDNSLEYWIDVSDVVVTINSTVGLEALLKNKKVVCIGESIYSGLSSINKFKDDKQIECDSHEVLNYLCFLIENNLIKSDSLYSHSVASKIIDFAEINVKKEIYFEKYKKFSSACFEGKKSLNVSLDFDFSSKLDLTYRKNNHPVSVDYLRKMLKEKLGDFEFNFINDKSSKFDIKIVDDKINYKHVDDHSVVIDYYGAFKYIEGLGVI